MNISRSNKKHAVTAVVGSPLYYLHLGLFICTATQEDGDHQKRC